MSDLPEQLALKVSLAGETTFTNYHCVTPSQQRARVMLLNLIQPITDVAQQLFVSSAEGMGASHLLQATCHAANDDGMRAQYLPLKVLCSYDPDAVCDGMERQQIVCIDDIECVCGNEQWEQALFHLYNNLKDAGHHLVIAGHTPASALNVGLLDLRSRLLSCVSVTIDTLMDVDKRVILQHRAQGCGLDMPDDVAEYIMKHAPRSLAALSSTLIALDHASLQAQRRLTIPFVKTVLQGL